MLLLILLSLCSPADGSFSSNLKDFERWFSASGGRWGTGVSPEVAWGPCYSPQAAWQDDVKSLGSYRVVTRSRVPKETVSTSCNWAHSPQTFSLAFPTFLSHPSTFPHNPTAADPSKCPSRDTDASIAPVQLCPV